MSEDAAARLKRLAAEAALEHVRPGMTVGLGTGSTAAFMIEGLGRLLRDGQLTDIQGVPTSEQTAALARQAGIPLTGLSPDGVDVAIDGCDEVDPSLQLIKGLGGALTREKLVAVAARRFIVVADESKAVNTLGEKAPVPVEVIPFGQELTRSLLEQLGGSCELRRDSAGRPVVTDNGNLVLDYHVEAGFDPQRLAAELKGVVGVVEHGLFLGLAHEAVLAGPEGLRVISR